VFGSGSKDVPQVPSGCFHNHDVCVGQALRRVSDPSLRRVART
jgi:hypothetical protein